uniref:Uncharacterized protein n=1 Tax=Cuerna arida TaxID=1464854 RepID=A0A1B6H3Z2_9HEMI
MLQVDRRVAKRRGNAEDSHYFDQWQEEWAQDTGKAEWTKRLIPDLRLWVNRKHGECSYHLTQVLSGHGCFGAYKRRFAIADDTVETQTLSGILFSTAQDGGY